MKPLYTANSKAVPLTQNSSSVPDYNVFIIKKKLAKKCLLLLVLTFIVTQRKHFTNIIQLNNKILNTKNINITLNYYTWLKSFEINN